MHWLLDNYKWVFDGIGVLIFGEVLRRVVSRRRRAPAYTPLPAPTQRPAVPEAETQRPPQVAAPAQTEGPASFSANVKVYTLKIPVGDFQNVDNLEVRELRQHISKLPGEADHGVVLYVNTGGGLVYGGERATKIGTNTYFLPYDPIERHKEAYSVYHHSFDDHFFYYLDIYVEHINPHSGVVTLRVCEAGTRV